MTPAEKIARIKKALHYAGDYHAWDDVLEGLNSGRYQIFDNDSGCIVTEIIQLPKKRYLNCWLLGGELPHVLDLVPDMERHALSNDCPELMAFGRRGWERVLPKMGWKITGTTFSKEARNAQ
jgi:hypothetical protein